MSEAGYTAALGRHGGGRAVSFSARDPYQTAPALVAVEDRQAGAGVSITPAVEAGAGQHHRGRGDYQGRGRQGRACRPGDRKRGREIEKGSRSEKLIAKPPSCRRSAAAYPASDIYNRPLGGPEFFSVGKKRG